MLGLTVVWFTKRSSYRECRGTLVVFDYVASIRVATVSCPPRDLWSLVSGAWSCGTWSVPSRVAGRNCLERARVAVNVSPWQAAAHRFLFKQNMSATPR